MSSTEGRRQSPRRPTNARSSRMHPGWRVFLLAFFSGILTAFAAVYAAIDADHGVWMFAVPAALFFWLGGSMAERLTDGENERLK